MATWHTTDSARYEWADAPSDDGELDNLLDVAKSAVVAYAPALVVTEPPTDDVPTSYRVAQLMQARNVWNSSNASTSGQNDGSEYGLASFPLDWQIRQILRPKRGVPVIA